VTLTATSLINTLPQHPGEDKQINTQHPGEDKQINTLPQHPGEDKQINTLPSVHHVV